MKLLPIDQHCVRLSEAVMDVVGWFTVGDWLRLGAAIERVEINTWKNDRFGPLCNDYGYDEARDVLLRQFVEDFTVFSMVWGSLEAMLDSMMLPPHPDKSQRGKISNACFYLSHQSTKQSQCLGLTEEVQVFRQTAERCLGLDRVRTRFDAGRSFSEASIGLYVVYELRNQFAHGRVSFPHPDAENRPISPHRRLVKHATRIVLTQIQMLVDCHLRHCDMPGYYSWYGENDVPLSTALLNLHLDGVG